MKTRKVETCLPMESVKRIMEIEGVSRNEAEKELLRWTAYYPCDEFLCVMDYDHEEGQCLESREDTEGAVEILDKATIYLH